MYWCLIFLSTFSGDDADDGSLDSQTKPQRSERSHMIIWQSPSPSVLSSALWQRSVFLEWTKDWADMLCCTCRTWDNILNGVQKNLNKWNCPHLTYEGQFHSFSFFQTPRRTLFHLCVLYTLCNSTVFILDCSFGWWRSLCAFLFYIIYVVVSDSIV